MTRQPSSSKRSRDVAPDALAGASDDCGALGSIGGTPVIAAAWRSNPAAQVDCFVTRCLA